MGEMTIMERIAYFMKEHKKFIRKAALAVVIVGLIIGSALADTKVYCFIQDGDSTKMTITPLKG